MIIFPDDLDKSNPKPRGKSIARVTCTEQSNKVGVAAIEGSQIVWDHVIEYAYVRR